MDYSLYCKHIHYGYFVCMVICVWHAMGAYSTIVNRILSKLQAHIRIASNSVEAV